jgi:hypothetical protein
MRTKTALSHAVCVVTQDAGLSSFSASSPTTSCPPASRTPNTAEIDRHSNSTLDRLIAQLGNASARQLVHDADCATSEHERSRNVPLLESGAASPSR